MRTRIAVALVCAAIALSGCASEADEPKEESTAVATPTPAADADLLEVCPQIEAAVAGMPDETIPSVEALEALNARLGEIRATADPEASNAIDVATRILLPLADASSSASERFSGLTDAVSAVATRCKAAGSTALQ